MRRDGQCVLVDIVDDGPGIPAEVRDHVFDPFFTTKETGRAPGSGSTPRGASSRSATPARSRSTPAPDGTTFHVWLPLEGTAR